MNEEEGTAAKPEFTPPAVDELPQGAQSFIAAQNASYQALGELFAPFMQHPGIARNFDQAMSKMREVGFWVNDAMNMMLHPELFQAPPAKESEDAPPAEG